MTEMEASKSNPMNFAPTGDAIGSAVGSSGNVGSGGNTLLRPQSSLLMPSGSRVAMRKASAVCLCECACLCVHVAVFFLSNKCMS